MVQTITANLSRVRTLAARQFGGVRGSVAIYTERAVPFRPSRAVHRMPRRVGVGFRPAVAQFALTICVHLGWRGRRIVDGGGCDDGRRLIAFVVEER